MDISIKKPCHENWDSFTPNEQGAFCGKCVKTVIDFSAKSITEIKLFFEDKTDQKICGRFENDQLAELSYDVFFSKFKRFNLTKRFAVIVYFTFGMWLFNSTSVIAQKGMQIKGDVEVRQIAPKKDTISCAKPRPSKITKGQVITVKPKEINDSFMLGKVIATPPKKTVPLQKKELPKQ